MEPSVAYFPHGVPQTIGEFGNQKIGTVEFGNVPRLLEQQREIIFKTTKSLKYLTVPIIQAWNLTSNVYELWYRIQMFPGRQVHLAEMNYLLLCHRALWRDLIRAFEKLGKERKGNGATAEDGFNILRMSCFWPIDDQFRKILNRESLLDEWWNYIRKVEDLIMEIIKWLGQTVNLGQSSLPLPVFLKIASLFTGLVRWLGDRTESGVLKGELLERSERLYSGMYRILEERVKAGELPEESLN